MNDLIRKALHDVRVSKALPTQSDVHVDSVLTGISVAYIQQARNFIATRMAPIIPVMKQSDKYFTFDRSDFFRDEAQRRGDSEESAGGGFRQSTDSYFADVWAYHKDVGHLVRANSDVDQEEVAARYVAQIMLLRLEIQWMTDFFATSVWTTDKTVATQWNDVTSDPIEDIEAGKETVLSTTGFEPNKLALSYPAFRQLKHHPDIVDRVKHTSRDSITAEVLASIFELEEVAVIKSVKTTSNEGATTATYAFTAGKHALLAYVAPQPALMEPSAMYTFAWDAVSEGLGDAIGTSRLDVPLKKATRIESELAFDHKVVAADLGYFFPSVVA